ncbi:hypothetical protein FACS18942_05390 [Planctomycetales bacterium]|nr:hypothetical protein FACS18942_05390 [Planctomycetales bacterium]
MKQLDRILFFFLLILSLPVFTSAADTVRVETRNGVPQIIVDGQPIRSRMFFGNPGSLPVEITADAKKYSFEFQPVESEPKTATIHFRFAHQEQFIVLDNILLQELDDSGKVARNVFGPCSFDKGQEDFGKDWTFYPPAREDSTGKVSVQPNCGENNSPAMFIQLIEPKKGLGWDDFHVYHLANLSLDKTKKYRLSFWAKSEKDTTAVIAFYRPGSTFTYLGGISSDFFRSQIKYAGESGARFVSFSVALPWKKNPQDEAAVFKSVDDACRRVISANYDALLIPRIPMDPPAWWVSENPDDIITWKGTPSSKARKVAAVSSLKYRKEASEKLAALIKHLEETFPKNIAGYHPGGQNTSEWFYEDSWGPAYNGYSPSDRTAWRVWLHSRYKDDAALQSAWENNSVSLATAEVPPPELRASKSGGVFRDIAVEKQQQQVLDFAEFQQDMMSDTVLAFAKTVREASKEKHLSVFFYGYLFEFGALGTSPATAGHYALRKVLQSQDIDILCSPISYFDRKAGGSAAAMTAAESVQLAGKLWLYEDDTRTHLTPKVHYIVPGGNDGADTQTQTIQLLLRNTAECAVRNFGIWWMDLTAAGWFDDPQLWAEMKKLEKIDNAFLKNPTLFKPEVAVFIDEASMLAVAAGGNSMSRPAVYNIREPLARMGTPYGQYLLDDFLNGKVETKVNVFAAEYQLSDETRNALKQKTAKSGTANIWCFAPAFLTPNRGGSIETMTDLTGFQFKQLNKNNAAKVNAWAEPTALGKSLGLEAGFGLKHPLEPLFAVADAKESEVLATYSDGSPAIVMRLGKNGEFNVFSGAPGLTSSLLRLAARKINVHLYTETDCNVYVNGDALVLHGAVDGNVKINFGKECKVSDYLDGAVIGSGTTLTLPLKFGETRVLEVK